MQDDRGTGDQPVLSGPVTPLNKRFAPALQLMPGTLLLLWWSSPTLAHAGMEYVVYGLGTGLASAIAVSIYLIRKVRFLLWRKSILVVLGFAATFFIIYMFSTLVLLALFT